MIKFLISATFVLVFLFIFVLVGSAMLWVVTKVLRLLFPGKFRPAGVRQTDENNPRHSRGWSQSGSFSFGKSFFSSCLSSSISCSIKALSSSLSCSIDF